MGGPAAPFRRSSCRTRSTERSSPGTELLRRQTARCLEGVLVGGSWPRSRDVATDLSDLIEVLTSHLGPITRVGLDTHAREGPSSPLATRTTSP
ncbi:DUF5994 family protein [Streptomyces sp. HB132]|uniref:DUF5994 family protein n=1 Tax=Streptomyces sp. HB132 TaxID=767388 RepID=UPI001EF79BAD|nr:DUF5994 family protein [Streptomyces sp. HB132]